MSFLTRILQVKRTEISALRGKHFLATRRKEANAFFSALKRGKEQRGVSFMAEIKLRSPSAGVLCDETKVTSLVYTYEKYADALSVVMDSSFFGGSPDIFKRVRAMTSVPLLYKDFVLHTCQVDEAVSLGADAVLLIARIVDAKVLAALVERCFSLGVEPVVEVFDEVEIPVALSSGARMVAVNARDLDTFEVNLQRAFSVLEMIPNRLFRLAFSGLETREDILEATLCGANGVLVGTALLQSSDPVSTFRKICSSLQPSVNFIH